MQPEEQSEGRFKSLFMSIKEGFYLSEVIRDPDGNPWDYRYLEVNPMFEKILGLDRDRIIGRRYRELVPVDTTQWLDTYFAVARTGAPANYEFYSPEYGTYFSTYVYRPAEDLVAVFVMDITERKRAEEALRKSEESYRTLVDNMQEAAFRCNLNGDITFANPSAARLLGYPSARSMIGMNIQRDLYVRPEQEAEIREALSKTGKITNYELTLKRWDATMVVVSSNSQLYRDKGGEVIGLEGTYNDITERKRSEEALRRNEGMLSSIFEASPAGIALLKDRKMLKTNRAFCRMTGYSEDELLGSSTMLAYGDEKEFERMGALYREVKEKGRGIAEARMKRKDGEAIQTLVYLSPVDPEDLGGMYVATVLDMTERKRMASEKARLEEMLMHSQKMEALGTMAGGIAHDFNNVLSAIFGYAELVLTVGNIPPETAAYIQEILNAGERARDLIGRILMFSRQTESVLKPVMPKYIIGEALKLLRASTPTHARLESVLKSDAAVMADPTMLHQVVFNLCNNSIHALQGKPGVIRFELEDLDVDAGFARLHPGLEPGRHVMIKVSDTGCGIPAEAVGRIFEPFFTTKPQGEGTGLGLSVVHGIITKLKGSISVYSEEGKGTVFNIVLPVVYKKIEVDRADSLIRGGTERVLLVDDEKAIVASLGQILKSLGYAVISFTDCREALEEFRRNPGGYDVVFTDFTMPHMNGIELAKKLKETRKDIPIILSSGYIARSGNEPASPDGISVLLSKPVSAYQLADAVRKALA